MVEDAAEVAQDLMPYALAAIGAYGAAVLGRVESEATDATVSFGRRVLRRLTGHDAADAEASGPAVPTEGQAALGITVRALADAPRSAELAAVLRAQLRQLFESHPVLASEIAGWPRPAAPSTVTVTTSGERAPAVHTNQGLIHTGDITVDAAR